MKNNYAEPLIRFFAYLTDFEIRLIVYLLIIIPIFSASDVTGILNAIVNSIILMIFGLLLFPLINSYLTSAFGGTIGKILFGLKVTDENGEQLNFSRALFRSYIGYGVSQLFLGAGFVYIFLDKKRRGWHDLATGSVVVNDAPQRIGLGFVTGVIILFINIFMVKTIVENYFQNRFAFSQISSSIQSVFGEVTPTLTPTPTVSSANLFCGGIAGIACPEGYTCLMDGNYPDAGGSCLRVNDLKYPDDMGCGGADNVLCPKGYYCEYIGDNLYAGGKCVKEESVVTPKYPG